MSAAGLHHDREGAALSSVRALANHAFSRAAGVSLFPDNSIRLLKDARENCPAWLVAIGAAKRHIHFESYIIHDDDTGRMFADEIPLLPRNGEIVFHRRRRQSHHRHKERQTAQLSKEVDHVFSDFIGWRSVVPV